MPRPDDPELDVQELTVLIEAARREDLGTAGDLTTQLMTPERREEKRSWVIRARAAGRFCGRDVLPTLVEKLTPNTELTWLLAADRGDDVTPGDAIARLAGPTAEILAAERTILNFLQRLSGIATLTARYVTAVAGTGAEIFDTRKTTPGLRSLEKYAVRCGGGRNHRCGLHDAVLIKDNHLAGIPPDRLARGVFEMLNGADSLPARPRFVEAECDRLDQLGELLKVVGIDVILLDNFETSDLRRAVELRDAAGLRGKVALEASGGVTLDSVRRVAETGVERIAVGAITHSAPALDLGLDPP
jgi:nicotinate-nucleotide pyrophosphorylase (carboxylating)